MITVNQFYKIMMDADINPLRASILDSQYVEPIKSWIEDEFSAALENNLRALGLLQWVPEAWDCDKYARLAWAFAVVDYARNRTHPEAGFAFGVFCYELDNDKGGHAINFFISNGQIMFYEPQLRKIVQLSETERQSCFCYIV